MIMLTFSNLTLKKINSLPWSLGQFSFQTNCQTMARGTISARDEDCPNLAKLEEPIS